MPNYVTNIVTFGSDEAAKAAFQRMLDTVRPEGKPLGTISFEKIIPMPEHVKMSRGVVRNGMPVTIQWCIDNWGSKWDAIDCCPLDRDAETAYFYTASTDVSPVMMALSKLFPEQTILYQWAENENIGANVGEMEVRNGEILSSLQPDDETRDAYEMAFQILDVDPADCGLYLSDDESTYEYREEPSEKSKPGPRNRNQAR